MPPFRPPPSFAVSIARLRPPSPLPRPPFAIRHPRHSIFFRSFHHRLPLRHPNTNSPPPNTSSRSKTAQDLAVDSSNVSNAEQRSRDWTIVRRLAVNIWPRNDWGTRGRVVLGVGLLIAGKVLLPFATLPAIAHP